MGWRNYDPGFELVEGCQLQVRERFRETDDATCGNGGRMDWRIVGPDGETIESGETCVCGRGCFGGDCIRDEWSYHDTALEEYRREGHMKPTKNTLDPARLPPLLTTDQVAGLLGISKTTLRKWAASGKIVAHKIGPKLWKYPREEVAKWLT